MTYKSKSTLTCILLKLLCISILAKVASSTNSYIPDNDYVHKDIRSLNGKASKTSNQKEAITTSANINSALFENTESISGNELINATIHRGELTPLYNYTFVYPSKSHKNQENQPSQIQSDDDNDDDLDGLDNGNDSGKYGVTSILFSANICGLPVNDINGTSQNHLVGWLKFEETGTWPFKFQNGYASQNVTINNYNFTASASIFLVIGFDDANDTFQDSDYFTVTFTISTESYLLGYDSGNYLEFLDTDYDSALFESAGYNTSDQSINNIVSDSVSYKLKIFEEDAENNKVQYLNQSWCAINTAAYSIETELFSEIYHQNQTDTAKKFYITGLNSSTTYDAFVIRNLDQGGYVFDRIGFTTQNTDACKIIFDLDFCTGVSYSVPKSLQYYQDENLTALKKLYDNYAQSAFQNFSYVMDQVACDAEDDAVFSPISSCDDCSNSYKNWLCSIVIPRCSSNTTTSDYPLREVGQSRNEFMNNIVQPQLSYNEVLPCIDTCFAIVKNCPSDFGFSCPKTMYGIKNNYNFIDDDDSSITRCNLLGKSGYSSPIQEIGPEASYG
ncbi:hypothetical protein WICMUC_002084 [Wickerhamomyces mucosus]|uniref:Stretch-activated cation channel MID1 n=1 Tax=Wickerhamomyces mucosus TaxID=1378264 RepID=A0A9P8PQ07_9ASCO|nr:hypothetical protein WICMUC_002084 [Wickerhamomyces mucosus]